nr:retrovirus-related Pol polyprotein from transposon TNT 1-94 [Tanacetum cinerariifolium]
MSAAKLPILNPNEFNLWKMRVEQYFLMTDYSLWEVILNGDSPAPTRVIEGVVQPVAPTTAEQRLARKNELKARVSVVASVSAASAKIPVVALPNVDTLSNERYFTRECRSPKETRRNVTAEPQRRNVPVETYTSNALVSQCDGVGSYDWSFQAEEEPTNYALMAFTSSDSFSSDNEVASCSKACTKAYATLQSHYDKLTNDFRKSQFDVISYKTGLESVKARLLVYQQNETIYEEDIKLLKLEVQLRDNALVILRQKFKKAKQERDDLKLKLEKFQTSSKNLRDGYHAFPPPQTGTFMPPKPNLVFHDAPNVNETAHTAFNVELSSTKPDKDLSHTHRSSAPIIEDWVSDSEDDYEVEIPQNAPSFVPPTKQVKTPRPSVKPAETSIPAAIYKTDISKSKSYRNSRNRKACVVCKSLTYLIKYCDYYENKMAQTPVRTHAQWGNHQQYARITLPNPQRQVVPKVVLTKSKLVPLTAARPVTTVVPQTHVTRPRQAKPFVDKPNLLSPSPIHHQEGTLTIDHPPKLVIFLQKLLLLRLLWHMTGNMSYLSDFEEINGGYVAFGGNLNGGKISGKGKIRIGKLDFDDVYFVKELKFNLFSVSHMCDKKNIVLFTDTECIVLSHEFKLPDENQVLLRVLRENNMYNVDLQNIVPSGDLTCLFAKATLDEFTWVFFLATKDETSPILKTFITGIENQSSLKVKIIRSDNETKFRNQDLNQFCGMKGLKREFSVPITPQQNRITERKNRTLIEAARTMLADSLLPIPFWAEAVNTACHVQNRVLVTKPHNKTPYELLLGRTPSIDPQNTNGDATIKVEPEFKGRKPESEVHVSPSNKFEDFSDNNINEVNATDSLVPAVGPTHEKSSYMDPSQYLDDPNMPALEDITYSKDEEDVGTEADFTNLETNITEQKDERGIVVRNKARLVAQGHTQEEGIDYKEVFAPVARLEAIRLFLAYASFMGFMVYQMDVKSAFLYGTIKEEVYVCQLLRFKDPTYPNKVYKVVKALYGLHQAPRAWKKKGDILLIQVYVDDIIFGFTNKDLCKAFEKLMKDKFQMSSMGELTFFGSINRKSASTPIDTEKPLLKDPDVDEKVGIEVSAVDLQVNAVRLIVTAVNDVLRLQALVDKKKVIITEATIRDALRLDDAESVDCLPNEEIYTELERMGMIVAQQADDVADEGAVGVDVDVVPVVAIIANIDADEDVTLRDVVVVAKEVEVEKDVEIEVDVNVQGRQEESQAQIYKIDLEHVDKVLSMQDDELEPAELEEVVEVVTTAKLMTKVVTAAAATITTATTPITAAILTAAPSVARRRKGVVIRDPEETSSPSIIIHSEPKSKDKGKEILNMAGFKMDYFKGMSYDDIRLIFEKYFNFNVAFLEKTKEHVEEEESRALKRKTESQAEKVAKKQKLDEEVKELRKHLQILPNDEDDVYTEATPLARKVPFVNYEMYTKNNKPYYKIMRADDSHQLFLSFLSLLRNFNREDLEVR